MIGSKKFIVAAIVIGSLGQTVLAKAQNVKDIQEGVVYVRVMRKDGTLFREGSGVILGADGYIFTSKHLFSDPLTDKIMVSLKGLKTHLIPAQRYPADQGSTDIALLYINSDNVAEAQIKQYFKLGCNLPKQMEPIQVAGFPEGEFNSLLVLPGVVTANGLNAELKGLMRAGIAGGMSGGPVLWRGYVVGLVYGAAGAVEAFTPVSQAATLRSVANVGCYTVPTGGPQQTSVIAASPSSTSSVTPITRVPLATSSASKSTLFIQIANEGQRKQAEDLSSQLREMGILVASGIENVGSKAPSSGQLRYFSTSDELAANGLQEALNSIAPGKFKATQVHVPNPPKKVFELWLPNTD